MTDALRPTSSDNHDFDLFVIGGGSGGVRAARMAAQRGARVALAEALGTAGLGGTCVNVGCIPKKLYSYAAHFSELFEESHGFGWEGAAPTLNWQTLKANRAKEITRLNGVYANLLKNSGVTTLHARARLLDAHHVAAGGRTYSAAHILISTGGHPHVPDFSGRELVDVSDAMFDLDPFPKRLLVVGGGYIASEFASIFNGLGSTVTQFYRGEQILRGFDHEVRDVVAREMGKTGVDIQLGAEVMSVRRTDAGLEVAWQRNAEAQPALVVDRVLYATGRVPNVGGLGLDDVGVRRGQHGGIEVDERYTTSVPSIHALGDVTARVQLTPVALGEAMVLVDHLFGPPEGKAARTMAYEFIPTAVFTHPNVGTVGYSEVEAHQRYGALRIYTSEFKALKHTLSGSSERTFMKLVVQDDTDRVVGLHMVGPDAGELVQGFAVAMKAGATKAVFDATVGIHPTAAEEFVTMREVTRRVG